MDAVITGLFEADERRAARDSYRAAGGSQRRPLKSFLTKAEKRERREGHAARIHAAIAEIQTAGGFEAWCEALDLNPNLSALNAALVALQTPGEMIGSAAGWHRLGYKVRKGERASGWITAPGFWPLAYFTAAQAAAGNLEGIEPRVPGEPVQEGLRSRLTALLASGEKPREVVDRIAAEVRAIG